MENGLGQENTLSYSTRVARTRPGSSVNCKSKRCQNVVDSLEHALVDCQSNDGVGIILLNFIRRFMPGLQTESMLRLEIHADEDLELPFVFLISTVLSCVWNLRVSGSRVQKYLVRSQLEAKINLLRETRYFPAADKLEEFTLSMFD